jgi:CelD/BcsL family acetyltransferase involved in cellulose biosynthesis
LTTVLAMQATARSSSSLTIEVREARELREDEIAAWRAILRDEPVYASPFFAPGYTQLVSRCIDGVMVGLLRQDGVVVGVFPYEMEAPGKARPVGSIYSDYQAFIVRRGVDWTVEFLFAGLGLEEWRFDHLLASQGDFARFARRHDVSWVVDLSMGFEAFEAALRKGKHRQVAEVRRKMRMMEREVGPIRFVPHIIDHALLEDLLATKSAQWADSGWRGRFTTSWERQLMHDLLDTDTPGFSGMLTVLLVADRPVAMHLGMRSHTVWHYWTTTYDRAFARYSPGNVMLVEMAKAAESLGLIEIDLGKEDFEYKRRLHNRVIPLLEGVVAMGASSLAAHDETPDEQKRCIL